MKRVLDSSVGVKWVIPEKDSDKALQLRDDFLNKIVELVSPDIFLIEAAHAITRAERQKRITPAEEAKALTHLLTTAPDLLRYVPLLPRAYELSSQFRIGVYDCLYVALAEHEKCDLVTAESRLISSLGQHFPFIFDLATLP